MRIRMETEQINYLSKKLLEFSRRIYQSSETLSHHEIRNSWRGNAAESFWNNLEEISKKFHYAAEETTKYTLALKNEREQWEEVDRKGVFRIQKIHKPSEKGQDYSWRLKLQAGYAQVSDAIENYKYNKDYII